MLEEPCNPDLWVALEAPERILRIAAPSGYVDWFDHPERPRPIGYVPPTEQDANYHLDSPRHD